MVKEIKPYIPSDKALEKIYQHSQDPQPLVIDSYEYDEILKEYGLHRGTRLSDVGILKSLEAGLIKFYDDEEKFNLLEQIQGAAIDMQLGHEFWHFISHKISRLTLGSHKKYLEDLNLLEYNYKIAGDVFVFHPNSLVLAFTQELVSLSNVITGSFDGRSSIARIGLSDHQTAGGIGPGFAGRILMEISNTNTLDVAVPILHKVGSIGFTLLDYPSTRSYNIYGDKMAFMQDSPFQFRKKQWDESKNEAIKKGLSQDAGKYEILGDPSLLNIRLVAT